MEGQKSRFSQPQESKTEQNFIKKSFFDFLDNSFKFDEFWICESELEQMIILDNLVVTEEEIFETQIYISKKDDDNNEIQEAKLRIQGDIMSYWIDDKPVGYIGLTRIKAEFFENLSEEKVPVIGEDFCILLSQNSQYETMFCQNIDDFQRLIQKLKKHCILTHFNKEYISQSVIGQGTFAKVILATKKSTGEKYAIKTFNKKRMMKNDNKKVTQTGIINEIHLMRHMDHKNIIRLHEVYEGEQHIYLVLDLLKGGELFDRITEVDHFDEKKSFEIIIQVIDAVYHIHRLNVMHRDIKPENLILRNQSNLELCLADFGLAEFVDSSKRLLTRCGTPGYVAPEVLLDKDYDERVDIFSVGVILYNLLTGCQVFGGNQLDQIIMKNERCIINWDFNKINIQLTEECEDLLRKILEKEPEKRISLKEIYNHPWIVKYNGVKNIPDQICIKQRYNKGPMQFNKGEQMVQMTPLITGKTNTIVQDSPMNTPGMNTVMAKNRQIEVKTLHQNVLSKYMKGEKKEETNIEQTSKKDQKKAAALGSKLKNMAI